MLKLSDTAANTFSHGLEMSFGASAANTIRFYKPETLLAANRPIDTFELAASMPKTPVVTLPFELSAA